MTNQSISLDPRSFHVFNRFEHDYLFDRSTATLSQLPQQLAIFLRAIESGKTYVEAAEEADIVESQLQDVYAYLHKLQDAGFFQFIPIDKALQDDFLEGLLRHKQRRIQLLMAQGCNLGCRYCYAWRNGSNQKNTLMTEWVAKRAVDYLIERSAHRKDLQICFFGGEPLLNYETIVSTVAYANTRGSETGKTFAYELTTNGTLLTDEIIAFCVQHRIAVMVSIDGYEEMHAYNRPPIHGQSSYWDIVSNAQKLNAAYKRAGIRPIKVRANLTKKHSDTRRTRAALSELGFERIDIARIEPLPHNTQSPAAMTEDQVAEETDKEFTAAVNALRKLERGESITDMDDYYMSGLTGKLEGSAIKGLSCGVARNTQCVDTSGNIYPCHRYEGMQEYIIGNVLRGFDREAARAYYRKVNRNATDRCHSCWLRDYCAGGCAWLLSAADGTIHNPTPRECDRRRKSAENGLWLRQELGRIAPERFTMQERDIEEMRVWQTVIDDEAKDNVDAERTLMNV